MEKFRIREQTGPCEVFQGAGEATFGGGAFQHLRLRSRRPGTGEFPGFPGGFYHPGKFLRDWPGQKRGEALFGYRVGQ